MTGAVLVLITTQTLDLFLPKFHIEQISIQFALTNFSSKHSHAIPESAA